MITLGLRLIELRDKVNMAASLAESRSEGALIDTLYELIECVQQLEAEVAELRANTCPRLS